MRGWASSTFLACLALGCASPRYVESPAARNHGGVLALGEARGARPEPGGSQLLVRYLRAGGVYFEWQGQALMTAPFASNYPIVASTPTERSDLPLHGRTAGMARSSKLLTSQTIAWDRRAIAHVMAGGMRLDRVQALLVGHSHYDHLGDVPPIATEYAKAATIYVNESGRNILASVPELRGRVVSVENEKGWLPKSRGASPPLFRFHAIPSAHAPNVRLFGHAVLWAPGHVRAPWTKPFVEHRLSELSVGTTQAFLIDFLDPDDPTRVAFRVHYQDAASEPPVGFPDAALIGERRVDLEVVCMPGRETLNEGPGRYPAGILRHTRARHALVIHYEDFLRPIFASDGSVNDVHVIPTLVGSTATDFLAAVVESVAEPDPGPCRRPERVEGLCSDAFTLPLPGEWLLFDAASR